MEKSSIVKHLAAIISCEQFLITGSYALENLGFKVTVKDIDIKVINIKPESIEMLKRLAEANPPTVPFKYPEHSQDRVIRFKMEGFDVDIFLENKIIVTTLKTKDGIEVTPLNYIVSAKKELRRPKDFIQLRRLAMQVMNNSEFTSFIDNVNFD